jgi:hypothetical protein
MDPIKMVTYEDLLKISAAFKRDRVEVEGIYFIKITTIEESVHWKVCVVTQHIQSDFIHKLIELRRAGKLPNLDPIVRVNPIRPSQTEARAVLDYASKFDRAPVTIRDVISNGFLIEYALVAEAPGLQKAAA